MTEIEDIDELENEVLVRENSKVFHFMVEKDIKVQGRTQSTCGNAKSRHTYEGGSYEDPRGVEKDGKRPCKDCIKDLKRFHDVDVRTCTICDRTSILHSGKYNIFEVEYRVGTKKTVSICLNCQVKFCIDY
jgi:hypothetical protein